LSDPDIVFTRPESVDTVVLRVDTVHESEAILPVAVVRLELVVAREPERVVILPVAVARLLFVVEREPESEERLLFVVAILPVSPATVPDIAFCALVLVK
jgi:hypothetical protein